jgi:hypothetical protein
LCMWKHLVWQVRWVRLYLQVPRGRDGRNMEQGYPRQKDLVSHYVKNKLSNFSATSMGKSVIPH